MAAFSSLYCLNEVSRAPVRVATALDFASAQQITLAALLIPASSNLSQRKKKPRRH